MTKHEKDFTIRELTKTDREGVVPFITSFWHSDRMVAKGRLFYPAQHDGFLALRGDEIIGLVTYERQGSDLEISLLDSRDREKGVGTSLVEHVVKKARQLQCKRIWAITTNDNIRAFRFYQKRGFDLAAFHQNAMEANRKIKPEIPMTGQEGIPIRHELEFEILL